MNIGKLKKFARRAWLPLSGFTLSAALALWFAFTFLADAIYFNDPEHKDAALRGWMTPRYIVLSYDLPRSVVMEILSLNKSDEGQQRRMSDIADKMGLTLDELTDKVRVEAIKYRETAQ